MPAVMKLAGWLSLLRFVLPHLLFAQPIIQHDLHLVLQPDQHHLQATDTISIPQLMGNSLAFRLHAGLQLTTSTPGAQLTAHPMPPQRSPETIATTSYSITLPADRHTVVLHYAGQLMPPLQANTTLPHPALDTAGAITHKTIFLAAPTYWYPRVENVRLTFTLDVQLPAAWDVVSQGRRSRHQRQHNSTHVRWVSPQPQEQIYLVGGPYTEYHQTSGALQVMAFLRTPDAALAQRYLDATAPYISMYESLIGPYPYAKFALLENSWESGYGMPSFTLMGSKVIRFPFILHTSYPHEILHNWWGNGVFIDASQGNWAEGLTAYLADHLMQEQRGTGAAYRRDALQKYADYVAQHQDFPLTAFRARHTTMTEAVGYNKAMMIFHMLRRQMGDPAFIQALQAFYHKHRFQRATFGDLLRRFGTTADIDPHDSFAQWIARRGAPQLRLGKASVRTEDADYLLSMIIQQEQAEPAYRLHIPIAVTLAGRKQAFETTVLMRDKRLQQTLRLPARPLRLDIDPQFDLFRRLHRREMPPALSQLFGAQRLMLVLPAAAPAGVRQGYLHLAKVWQQKAPQQIEIRWDHTLTSLPADRAVWLCGWENRWRSQFDIALTPYDIAVQPDSIRLVEATLQRAEHAVVITARHPFNAQLPIAWLGADRPEALPGLARKLPHYGKYSYLAFSGDEPSNRLKGQWPVVQSPMTIHLTQSNDPKPPMARLRTHPPLISLPPVAGASQ